MTGDYIGKASAIEDIAIKLYMASQPDQLHRDAAVRIAGEALWTALEEGNKHIGAIRRSQSTALPPISEGYLPNSENSAWQVRQRRAAWIAARDLHLHHYREHLNLRQFQVRWQRARALLREITDVGKN